MARRRRSGTGGCGAGGSVAGDFVTGGFVAGDTGIPDSSDESNGVWESNGVVSGGGGVEGDIKKSGSSKVLSGY